VKRWIGICLIGTFPACGDGGGGGNPAGSSGTQANRAPQATITASDPQPLVGATAVNFAANASDPDGDPLTYSWAFGDGSTATGQSVTYVYPRPGVYNVTVTVNDSRGANASATAPVTARSVDGVWFSEARAWYFELSQTQNRISGRLLGFKDVRFANPPPVTGSVSNPRVVRFEVPEAIGFDGTLDQDGQRIRGTLDEGRTYGEVLVKQ
jgi:hypothetical protein